MPILYLCTASSPNKPIYFQFDYYCYMECNTNDGRWCIRPNMKYDLPLSTCQASYIYSVQIKVHNHHIYIIDYFLFVCQDSNTQCINHYTYPYLYVVKHYIFFAKIYFPSTIFLLRGVKILYSLAQPLIFTYI